MTWTREKLFFYLFDHKIIQNCLKIDASHYYGYDLLLRLETQKRLHVLEADIIKNNNIDLMSLAQRTSQDEFKMTAIELISVITQYHINGLHLFCATSYSNKMFKPTIEKHTRS